MYFLRHDDCVHLSVRGGPGAVFCCSGADTMVTRRYRWGARAALQVRRCSNALDEGVLMAWGCWTRDLDYYITFTLRTWKYGHGIYQIMRITLWEIFSGIYVLGFFFRMFFFLRHWQSLVFVEYRIISWYSFCYSFAISFMKSYQNFISACTTCRCTYPKRESKSVCQVMYGCVCVYDMYMCKCILYTPTLKHVLNDFL